MTTDQPTQRGDDPVESAETAGERLDEKLGDAGADPHSGGEVWVE